MRKKLVPEAEMLMTNTDLGAVLMQLTVYLGMQIIDK